jgi:glycosyltransferase involved in cell wall biosynthesis
MLRCGTRRKPIACAEARFSIGNVEPSITVTRMPTTVLVDAWHLSGFSSGRGIGTFIRELLPRLADDPGLEVIGLAPRATSLPAGVRHWPIGRAAPDRLAQREHDLRLPFDLSRAAKGVDADVVLSPGDNPPRHSPRPWVQVLHDLTPLVLADPGYRTTAKRWRRIGPRLCGAVAVVTDSHNTARDAVRLLEVDPRRVHVAPLGVSDGFRPPEERCPTEPPTIAYVGEYGPNKGFTEAFAVSSAIAESGLRHRLAMVGFLAPWHEPVVRALLASAPRPDRVDLLGYVEDIVELYQRADALIVTSRYEGFCLPAVEAMACGTPVVAFANSAITEAVNGGGVLVPDGDVEAMVAELRALLTDDLAWHETSARGLDHVHGFSWDSCARVHAEVLRTAARVSS